jgi:hypothetical protein
MWVLLALCLVVGMEGSTLELRAALLPHQLEFVAARTGVTALTGGYGSGKSTSGALKGVLHSMWDPGILHAICSPSFPMAKLTIIPSIYEVLEEWFGLEEDKHFAYNKTDHYFDLFFWGGKLVILSGEEPKRLKGPNLGSFGIDEPGLQAHAVYKQGKARVRHPKAKYPEVYLTGTPEDLNWYADLVEGDLRPKGLVDIRAHTRDNFFLSEDYFRGLEESYSEQEILAYMAGRFVNLNDSLAYSAFTPQNIIERAEFGEPDPELPLLVGFDYNWSPNVGVVAQEVPDWVEAPGAAPQPKLVVFDELWFMNCSTERKCELLVERFGDKFEYLIYQDAAGKSNNARTPGVSDLNLVRNAMRGVSHRVYYPNANPLRRDRLNSVNGRLRNSRGERFIYITRNCKHLLDDMRKTPREEFLVGKYKDSTMGHIGDALGYLVNYRYPIRRKVNHSNRAVV